MSKFRVGSWKFMSSKAFAGMLSTQASGHAVTAAASVRVYYFLAKAQGLNVSRKRVASSFLDCALSRPVMRPSYATKGASHGCFVCAYEV